MAYNPVIFAEAVLAHQRAGYRFDAAVAMQYYLARIDAAKCGRGWEGVKGKCKRSKPTKGTSSVDRAAVSSKGQAKAKVKGDKPAAKPERQKEAIAQLKKGEDIRVAGRKLSEDQKQALLKELQDQAKGNVNPDKQKQQSTNPEDAIQSLYEAQQKEREAKLGRPGGTATLKRETPATVGGNDPRIKHKDGFMNEWGHTFDGADDEIIAAINNLPAPKKVTKDGSPHYHPSQNGISMVGEEPGRGRAKMVAIHEYGHHLDFNYGDAQSVKLAQKSKAGLSAAFSALKSAAKDVRQGKAPKGFLKQLRSEYKEAVMKDARITRKSTASASPRGKAALRSDRDHLFAQQKKYQASQVKAAEKFLSNAYDAKTGKYDLKAFGDADIGDIVADAIMSNEPPESVAKLLQGSKEAEILSDLQVKSEPLKLEDDHLKEIASRLSTDRGELARSVKERLAKAQMGDVESYLELAEMATATQRGGHQALLIQDLVGSTTKNAIGKGHSSEYYESSPTAAGVEAFANAFALQSSGDPLDLEIAKRVAPNMTRFTRDVVKEIANRGSRN